MAAGPPPRGGGRLPARGCPGADRGRTGVPQVGWPSATRGDPVTWRKGAVAPVGPPFRSGPIDGQPSTRSGPRPSRCACIAPAAEGWARTPRAATSRSAPRRAVGCPTRGLYGGGRTPSGLENHDGHGRAGGPPDAKPASEAEVTSFLEEGWPWSRRNRPPSPGSRSALAHHRHPSLPRPRAALTCTGTPP